jgi:predicted NBD/HSP70 family sugar kinase
MRNSGKERFLFAADLPDIQGPVAEIQAETCESVLGTRQQHAEWMTVEPESFGTTRELNRLRVVDALRRAGTASRSDLARTTGLSRTTVASLVSDLQSRGLIVEQDSERPRRTGPGRPPVLLRLDAAAGSALGIDFGHRHVRVAVADLSSSVLAERFLELDVDDAPEESLDAAAELVAEVLADAGVDRSRVIGAGMALAAPIDRHKGVLGSTVLPGWAGIQAGEELSRRLEIPVELDNDANLGALAEVSFGAGRGLADVVYVMMSAGIGAGLVLGGRLYHGASGTAGELGHVQIRPDGAVCRCGSRGCLETVAGTGPLLSLLRPTHGAELTLHALLELVVDGDLPARRVVNDAGRAVGRALADLCNYLNPAAVIVGGDLSLAGDSLLDGIREAIDRYALPGAAAAVEVRAAVLGERAEVLGALALVIADTERLRTAGLAPLASGR